MKGVVYIVAVFHNGIGYTYQCDNAVHLFFNASVKAYEKSGHAINRAKKLLSKYKVDKVCVLKLDTKEDVYQTKLKDWYNDPDRCIWKYENKE